MSKTTRINGFSLVESMMAVLIFSLSGLAFSSFVTISANTQSKNKAKMSVAQSKGQILSMIANRATWFRNLKDAGVVTYKQAAKLSDSDTAHSLPTNVKNKPINSELACIREGTLCTETDVGYPLTLVDNAGNIVVDAVDQSKGFTRDGAVCTGFSETTTNEACPWRMKLTWNPICPTSAPCKHPQVNINVTVLASESFLQSNNLTTTQVSVLIEQPKFQPAFARKILFLTNSEHYGYPSDLVIDPNPYVVTESPGTLTYSLPKNVTVRGGKVTQSGQTFIYQPTYDASVVPVPDEKIYGTDWFTYKIKDSYTGIETLATAYIQVMTPYTWTGLAGNGDLSLSNPKNFCGKVVNNVCDGTTFPTAFMDKDHDANLVFNENCTNCNASILAKTTATSLETSPYYAGTIVQQADMIAAGYTSAYGASVWRKTAAFKFTSGLWDGRSGTLTIARVGEKYTCYQCQVPLNSYFRLEGGTFKAPPLVVVAGSLYMPSPTAFQHNGGTFHWLGMNQWGSVQCAGECYIGSEDVQFNNLIVGAPDASLNGNKMAVGDFTYDLSWQNRTYIKNGFQVLNTLTVANVANEAQLATYEPSVTIKLYGNYILPTSNAGGDYSYGNPSSILMTGTADQTIVGQTLNAIDRKDYGKGNCGPGVVVDKPSGKITMKDYICFNGDFLVKNAGSYDTQTASLSNRGFKWNVPVALDLHGQPVSGLYYLTGIHLKLMSDITVNDMLYYDSPYSGIAAIVNDAATMRNIHVKGNAEFGPTAHFTLDHCNVASTFLFDGTGAQTVTGSMGMNRAMGNHFVVNKPSGTLNFDGEFGIMQDFLLQSGLVTFGPNFGIHNVVTGADSIRTRIRLNSPGNQVVPRIVSNRTIEALSVINVKDLTLNSVGDWIGATYSNLYGGASRQINVSGNLTFGNIGVNTNGYGIPITQSLMGARTGTQKVMLVGGAEQTIEILGSNTTGAQSTLDLQIEKTTGRVTLKGNGQILNMTVAPGAVVDLDTSSQLALSGVVKGTLNKFGTSTTGGTLTTSGSGVINN